MADYDDDRHDSRRRERGGERDRRRERGGGGGRRGGSGSSGRRGGGGSRSRSRSRSRSPDGGGGGGGGGGHRRGGGSSRRSPSSRHGGGRSGSRSRSRSRSRSGSPRQAGGGGPNNPLLLPAGVPVGVGVGVPQPLINPYGPQSTSSSLLAAGGGGGGLSYAMAQQQQPLLNAQDKISRELFVGNVPPGTSEALLMQFLNGAMRRVGLCGPTDSPIISCRTNAKFAFVECGSLDAASVALNLNGIPFLGSSLRVSRPSKYGGPHTPSQTWQQLTGQPLPPGMTPVPENPGGNVIGPGGMIIASSNPEEKLQRELFVGNTTPEMTEPMLKDFLGRALEQVGLTIFPGNPILACRVSGKFAFVELRSKEEAANALNLNNIPYLGAQLRVGRPSKYTGPLTPHGNWEDILAKFMSGELQLNNVGGGMQQQQANPPHAAAPAASSPSAAAVADQQQRPPTAIVELKQMLTLKDLVDDAEYEDILEDTRDECSPFGTLKNIVIPRDGPGATKIFLEYVTVEDAGRAIAGLAGRTFDGRKVEAVYFDPVKFANQDYSD